MPRHFTWLTNDPTAAQALRKADRDYRTALAQADSLPLAGKVAAIRLAREARQLAYSAAVRTTAQ